MFKPMPSRYRDLIEQCATMEVFEKGLTVSVKGEKSSELCLVIQGSAAVVNEETLEHEWDRVEVWGGSGMLSTTFYDIRTMETTTAMVISEEVLDHLEIGLKTFVCAAPFMKWALRRTALAKHQDSLIERLLFMVKICEFSPGFIDFEEEVRLIFVLGGDLYVPEKDYACGVGSVHGAEPATDVMVGEYETGIDVPCLLGVLYASDWKKVFHFDSLEESLAHARKKETLKNVFVFQTLSEKNLDLLARNLSTVTKCNGDTVIAEGSPGRNFYVVSNGTVALTSGGKLIKNLSNGDFFGERALLHEENRNASATVVSDTADLWTVDKEIFLMIVNGPLLEYLEERILLQNSDFELKDLKVVRLLGKGGFGKVHLVQHVKTKTRYALKQLDRRYIVEAGIQEAILSERQILIDVDHPFIIKFVKAFHDARTIYLVTEVCMGGELLDALAELELLEKPDAWFYIGTIAYILQYLHSRRIIYRDLKNENLLVDNQGYLKLIDFGIAKRLHAERTHTLVGTAVFMAPEVLKAKGYGMLVDIWAAGVCFYEYVIGHFPFGDKCTSQMDIFQSILRDDLVWPKWYKDEEGRLFGSQLLCKAPSRRLTALRGYKEIYKHPYFVGFDWEGLISRKLTPPYTPPSEITLSTTVTETATNNEEFSSSTNRASSKRRSATSVRSAESAGSAGSRSSPNRSRIAKISSSPLSKKSKNRKPMRFAGQHALPDVWVDPNPSWASVFS